MVANVTKCAGGVTSFVARDIVAAWIPGIYLSGGLLGGKWPKA